MDKPLCLGSRDADEPESWPCLEIGRLHGCFPLGRSNVLPDVGFENELQAGQSSDVFNVVMVLRAFGVRRNKPLGLEPLKRLVGKVRGTPYLDSRFAVGEDFLLSGKIVFDQHVKAPQQPLVFLF